MKCFQIRRLIKADPIEKIAKIEVNLLNIAPAKIHIVDFKKLATYKRQFQEDRKK
jgi:hypothetical protein